MALNQPHLKHSLNDLKNQAEQLVNERKQTGEIYTFAIGLPQTGELVCTNSQKLYSASVMKLFVMAAIMDQYDQIIERYGRNRIDDALEGMITASSNTDWALLVMVLGDGDYQKGVRVLKEWNLEHGYPETEMVIDPYGNYTSVRDVAKLLMDIDQNRLRKSEQMKDLLERQAIPGRIRAGLPKDVSVGNKPGWIDHHDHDAAIVFSPKGTYVLCVMSEDLHNTKNIQDLTRDLSSLVYDWMQENMEDFTTDPRAYREPVRQDRSLILKTLKTNTSTLLEAFHTLEANWNSLMDSGSNRSEESENHE